jgi:hypothetical protein
VARAACREVRTLREDRLDGYFVQRTSGVTRKNDQTVRVSVVFHWQDKMDFKLTSSWHIAVPRQVL